MARYRLIECGVNDTETQMDIPNDAKNRHWQEYQLWISAGNVPDTYIAPAYTGAMELTALQSRLAAYTQNTIVLDATGSGTITHGLGSLWYDITTPATVTQDKTINTVKVSGGTPGERITYSLRLIIPECLNHLLTRTP